MGLDLPFRHAFMLLSNDSIHFTKLHLDLAVFSLHLYYSEYISQGCLTKLTRNRKPITRKPLVPRSILSRNIRKSMISNSMAPASGSSSLSPSPSPYPRLLRDPFMSLFPSTRSPHPQPQQQLTPQTQPLRPTSLDLPRAQRSTLPIHRSRPLPQTRRAPGPQPTRPHPRPRPRQLVLLRILRADGIPRGPANRLLAPTPRP